MTRPTGDALEAATLSIRQACDDMCLTGTGFVSFSLREDGKIYAERIDPQRIQIDADASGTGRQPDEICDCGFARGSFGCDDSHRILAELTTSPERVQVPAESEHAAPFDRCPTCTAHMPVGKTCGGVNCGLRGKE